jgi:hypothetical protein
MSAADLVARVAATKAITPAEVFAARKIVYGDDGAMASAELDMLFAMDSAASSRVDGWIDLFAEAVADYYVHQVQPAGYIDAHNAADLMARITRDGRITAISELEALVKCLEAARSAPPELGVFALRQVAAAVIEGSGPLARGRLLEAGRVGRDEAELMRRILRAGGGEDGMAISRQEAEVLFEINDRTAGAENDPAWTDVFIRSIGSFIMAASGFPPPSREDVLRREAWLDDTSVSVGGFFGRMASGILDGWRGSRSFEEAMAVRNRQNAEASKMAAVVTNDEVEWLASRIGRDQVVTPNEKALLAFIAEDSHRLHPKLAELASRAA